VPGSVCSWGFHDQRGTRLCRPQSAEPLDYRRARIRRCRASPSHLPVRLEIIFVRHSQDPHIPFFRSFASKLAIHRRYTERRLLCIPSCYLQGITVRPVPCNYNVIQSVSAFHGDDAGSNRNEKGGSISQISRRGLRPRGQGIPPVGKPVLSTFDDVNEIAATFSVRQ